MKKVKTRRNCLRRAGFEKWLGLLGGFVKEEKMRFVMGPPTRDESLLRRSRKSEVDITSGEGGDKGGDKKPQNPRERQRHSFDETDSGGGSGKKKEEERRSKMCERVEERVRRRCCLRSVVFRLDLMRR